jgi:CubicO group peptidase (beta-lactamase class C family)
MHSIPCARVVLATLAIAGALTAAAPAQTTGLGSTELDRFITKNMAQMRTPGLSVAVVKHGTVIWSKGYGLADISSGTPVTADTPFYQASVSKTVTAAAIMQLWEQGLLGLDDDVNAFLPFSARNPSFPDVPITFRMLLGHDSSISTTSDFVAPLTYGFDCPVALGDFLAACLVPGGSLYFPGHWRPYAPGTAFEYSNVGYALLGYLVERVSGEAFDEYCRNHIFTPLGMTDTSWRAADFPSFSVQPATQYYATIGPAGNVPCGFGGTAIYPCTSLTTSASQLAKWLLLYMDGGSYGGVQILQPATVDLMQTERYTDVLQSVIPGTKHSYGLGMLFVSKGPHISESIVGHAGIYDGAVSNMFASVNGDVGVIVLANSNWVSLPNSSWLLCPGWAHAGYHSVVGRLLDEAAAAP